jgi:hypothetical protein
MTREQRLALLLPAVILSAALPARAQRLTEPLFPADVDMWVNRANIEFRVFKNQAAIYEFGGRLAKPYFWPLQAPNHKQVTRSWPMLAAAPGGSTDSPHYKSAWFGFGDVIPEGLSLKRKVKGVEGVDFWSETPNSGRIVCVSVRDDKTDQNRAYVTTRNEWRTADGDKILDETRKILFVNYETARLLVLDIDLYASVAPITFGDTREGAMAVRVADSMRENRGKGRIINAEGKVGEKNCWGRVSPWCDYSGPVEDQIVGIALFAGPDNPYPSAWDCRASGLMAANPFGREKSGFPAMKDKTERLRLDKGKHLKLRYGLFVHLGDAKQGQVAENYERFTKLPKEGAKAARP